MKISFLILLLSFLGCNGTVNLSKPESESVVGVSQSAESVGEQIESSVNLVSAKLEQLTIVSSLSDILQNFGYFGSKEPVQIQVAATAEESNEENIASEIIKMLVFERKENDIFLFRLDPECETDDFGCAKVKQHVGIAFNTKSEVITLRWKNIDLISLKSSSNNLEFSLSMSSNLFEEVRTELFPADHGIHEIFSKISFTSVSSSLILGDSIELSVSLPGSSSYEQDEDKIEFKNLSVLLNLDQTESGKVQLSFAQDSALHIGRFSEDPVTGENALTGHYVIKNNNDLSFALDLKNAEPEKLLMSHLQGSAHYISASQNLSLIEISIPSLEIIRTNDFVTVQKKSDHPFSGLVNRQDELGIEMDASATVSMSSVLTIPIGSFDTGLIEVGSGEFVNASVIMDGQDANFVLDHETPLDTAGLFGSSDSDYQPASLDENCRKDNFRIADENYSSIDLESVYSFSLVSSINIIGTPSCHSSSKSYSYYCADNDQWHSHWNWGNGDNPLVTPLYSNWIGSNDCSNPKLVVCVSSEGHQDSYNVIPAYDGDDALCKVLDVKFFP